MRWVKKIFKILFFTILLLTGILWLLGSFYEDKITGLISNEINKNLIRTVHINPQDIELTLFDKFPDASIVFKNIYAFDNNEEQKDTLFSLGKIYASFNIMDIIHQNVDIKEVHLENGSINVRYSQWGLPNYIIWKADTTQSSQVNFNIQGIHLDNIQLRYDDFKEDHHFSVALNSFKTDVNLSNTSTKLSLKGAFNKLELNHYWKDAPLLNGQLNTAMVIRGDSIDILPSNLLVLGNEIQLNGKLFPENSRFNYQIKNVNTKQFGVIKEIQAYAKEINAFKGAVAIEGNIQQVNKLQFEHRLAFESENASYRLDSLTIQNIETKGALYMGNLSYPNRYELKIDTSKFNIANQEVKIAGLIKDGSWIEVTGNMLGKFKPLLPYFNLKPTQSLAGTHKSSFKIKSKLDALINSPQEQVKLEGNIENFQFTDNSMEVNISQSKLEYQWTGNRFSFRNFEGVYNQTDLKATGYIGNLNTNNDLKIVANVQSPYVDLTNIIPSTDSENETSITIPDNVLLDLSVDILDFKSDKFTANNVIGKFKYLNQQLYFFPLSMFTSEGKIQLRGKFDARNEGLINLKCNAELEHIRLKSFFASFHNFGQNYVTDAHIDGFTDASIETNIPFDLKLNPITKDIYAVCEITITEGRLRNNESMKELAEYIKVEELNDIKFSKLNNRIKIANEKIFIPEMIISSSALDVQLEGTHDFNQNVDYAFVLSLDELLAARAKKKKKENEAFGTIIEDGSNGVRLFVKMTGNLADPEIKYDRKSMSQTIKEEIKEEKKDIKEAIIEELKSFKLNKKEDEEEKTPKQTPKDENVPTFEIEWEDEEDWN